MKIYIVDDSELLRKAMKALLLQSADIEIAGEADNAHDAVDDILTLKPDAILLDIRMPGGSGIDIIKSIKNENLSTVIIVFTNYTHPRYRKRCMELGADFFFEKSTDFDKVPQVLEQLASVG